MARPSPKVSLEKEQELWRTFEVDAFGLKKGNLVRHFLLMLDEALGFPSSMRSCHILTNNVRTSQPHWMLWCNVGSNIGTPACLRCDLEGAFRGGLLPQQRH